jgi:hypothetical protein
MAATPYKPVTWGDEPIFKDKLNQMTNNDQYIYENMPRVTFNTYGIKRANGLKIMASIAVVPTSLTGWSSATVNFGTFFSSGSRPVIVTGTQPTSGRMRYQVAIKGIGTGIFYPDHRGFEVHVGADEVLGRNNVVDAKVYIHFIAIGW